MMLRTLSVKKIVGSATSITIQGRDIFYYISYSGYLDTD